jgi:hypothetical protein
VQTIVELRSELEAAGHDAGPVTIAYRLADRLSDPPSRTTIWRMPQRDVLVRRQPQKRPHCSRIRFEALPLYYFVGDRHPGEVNCQGIEELGGNWYVVTRRGSVGALRGRPGREGTFAELVERCHGLSSRSR